MNAEVRRTALEVVRSLPARTANEIRFLWQVVDGTTDSDVYAACAGALPFVKPKNEEARRELEKGKASHVKEIREAVMEILEQKK